MNNTVVICTVISAFFAFLIIAFAIFAIGFLIGYKHEEKKIIKRTFEKNEHLTQETEEEKKAKKEWKKFLEYDGSATN